MPAATFDVGDRVKMARHCPIDFEGVGPLPGEVGEVVALPRRDDRRRRAGVRFERGSAPWRIPVDYLERA